MVSLSVELCAFSVAIALVCRPSKPANHQWSIGSLSAELRMMDHYEDHNFRFDALALHQGLSIFKKTIEQFGCSVISISSKGEMRTEAFMDLAARSRGTDIKFGTNHLNGDKSRDYLVTEITSTANTLLIKTCKADSKYVSISEIYGLLWLNQLDVNNAKSESFKRRKKGDEIGDRQMGRYAKEVYEFVSNSICAANESPTIYINAAIKESASRSAGALEAVRRKIFDDDDVDETVTISQIINHPAVHQILGKFPNKNIRFKLHEIQLVISLFDAITAARSELEGEKYIANNIVTATHTKEILIKHARYSELVVETIVRWVVKRDVVKKTCGRKISVEFEADIWGNLMICEFEQKNVSIIKIHRDTSFYYIK